MVGSLNLKFLKVFLLLTLKQSSKLDRNFSNSTKSNQQDSLLSSQGSDQICRRKIVLKSVPGTAGRWWSSESPGTKAFSWMCWDGRLKLYMWLCSRLGAPYLEEKRPVNGFDARAGKASICMKVIAAIKLKRGINRAEFVFILIRAPTFPSTGPRTFFTYSEQIFTWAFTSLHGRSLAEQKIDRASLNIFCTIHNTALMCMEKVKCAKFKSVPAPTWAPRKKHSDTNYATADDSVIVFELWLERKGIIGDSSMGLMNK